jgi:hypothetical protein
VVEAGLLITLPHLQGFQVDLVVEVQFGVLEDLLLQVKAITVVLEHIFLHMELVQAEAEVQVRLVEMLV